MFYLLLHTGMKIDVVSVAEKYMNRVSKFIVPLESNYFSYLSNSGNSSGLGHSKLVIVLIVSEYVGPNIPL